MRIFLLLFLILNFASANVSNPVTDVTIQTSDVTTNNASASKHGFLPKLDNTGTKYLRDDGIWSAVSGTGGGSTNMILNTFSGNGVSTTFTLSSDPVFEENTFIYLSGVYQNKSTYTTSGTSLVFSSAPTSGTNNIEVMVGTVSGAGGGGGEVNTASNVGTGQGLFKQKSGVDLQFKTLLSSSGNLSITSGTNEVTLGFTTFPTVDGFATAILGTDAFTPGAGYNNLYFKSNGLNYITPSATVVTMAETTTNQTYTGTPNFSAGVSMTGDMDVSGSITFQATRDNQPAPAAGEVRVFGKSVGGRNMPSFIGPSGVESVLQPHIGRNRAVWWQPLGNATTVPITTGIIAASVSGTATARNVATTNVLTRMKRLGYVSSAVAGNGAAVYWPAGGQQYTLGNGSGLGGFHSVFRFATSDAAAVTGARMFAGWRTVVTAPTNVDPAAQTNQIGVAQLSTDSTQWYIVYGGSVSQSAIALGTSLGSPASATTAWDFSVFSPPSSSSTVYYTMTNLGTGSTVSGTLSGNNGTVLPSALSFMAPALWRNNNATALAVGLDVSSVYIETDQ